MAIRYTGGPIAYQPSIDSASSSQLINGLDAVLAHTAIGRTLVTGGFKYTLSSPETLQMKVWVQDLGDHDEFRSYIRVTPTSEDESLVGYYAMLPYDGTVYEAWANRCQFFVGPFGGSANPNNFACGVLALPPGSSGSCTAAAPLPAVTQLWWSSAGNEGIGSYDFRNCRYANGGINLAYNGAFVPPGVFPLNLVTMCESLNVDYAYGNPGTIQKYTSGLGLRIDALLSLGQQIYGQLWDAHIYTQAATIDQIVPLTDTDSAGNDFDTTWLTWNYGAPGAGAGTVLGTLFLLVNKYANSLANIVY